MSFICFHSLPYFLQVEIISNQAVSIGSEVYSNYTKKLFQYHDFYIEVYYNDRFEITRIETFKDIDGLEEYLNKINIDNLLYV